MVSLRRRTGEGPARSAASCRSCCSSGALYYGVHIGGVYWRYYQLLDDMRQQAQRADQLTDDAIQPPPDRPGGLDPRPDARVPDRPRRPAQPDHHRDRVHRDRRPARLQPHVRAAAPRRGAAVRCSVPADGGLDVARLFLALAAILVAAKLLGELAERIGQPAVLGELVAGVLLGRQRPRASSRPTARRAR